MCGRSGRGNRTEPTGKFSPAARAAISARSTQPFLLEWPQAERGEGGNELSEGGASGPEAAVTGVARRDGPVLPSLAGELALYNAEEVRGALLAPSADEPTTLVVD